MVYPRTTRQARALGTGALLVGVALAAVRHPASLVTGLLVILVGLVVVRYPGFLAGGVGPATGE